MTTDTLKVAQDMLQAKGVAAHLDYSGRLFTDEQALVGERIVRVHHGHDSTEHAEYLDLWCESGLRLRIVVSEWISGVRCLGVEDEKEPHP